MSYNSENTKVLATHTWENKERGGNVHMLLLHEKDDPHFPYEYVIGSYFTESIEYMEPFGQFPEGVIVDRSGTCFDVATGHEVGQANNFLSYQDPAYYDAALENRKVNGKRIHYSWDWGHYFDDIVHAVDYWKREILCVDDTDRFMCPDCTGIYGEHPVELVHEEGTWTCPMCGCSTSAPEEDACIRIYS